MARRSTSSDCFVGHGMPNGTLCGKAVVEMMLARTQGVAIEEVQEELIRNGDLPRCYVISKERMLRCKELDSVAKQEEHGLDGARFRKRHLAGNL